MASGVDHPRRPGDHAFRSEVSGLSQRPACQVVPGYSIAEAGPVLDPGRCSRLPAGIQAHDDHAAQPLCRTIDRGRQPGRPTAQDHEIVVKVRGVHLEPCGPRHVPHYRFREAGSGEQFQHRLLSARYRRINGHPVKRHVF